MLKKRLHQQQQQQQGQQQTLEHIPLGNKRLLFIYLRGHYKLLKLPQP